MSDVLNAASTMLADNAPVAPEQTAAPAAPDTQAAPQVEGAPAAPEAKSDEAPAVTMPGKDATPEQWAEFYAKLRPESADAYELPVPEGDDGAFAKEASTWMHEAGLSKEQASKLAEKWNAMAAKQQEAWAAEEAAAAQAQHAKNVAEQGELQKEWGGQYEAKMHHAKMAVNQFLPKDQAEGIISAIESKVGYKATIQFLNTIGERLGEHDAAGLGQQTAGTTAKSLEERLYGGKSQ